MKEIDVSQLNLNPMTMIGSEWWLITAGNEPSGYNTMTAAWGHLGALWERRGKKGGSKTLPTAVVYVRPQRFTKEFMDREELYTLSVFDETYRKALGYLGTRSGRDENKIVKTDVTPAFIDGTTYFADAKMVFVCRKLYNAPLLASGFVDKSLMEDNYPEKDFHQVYVGEIIKVLVAE